MPNVVPDTKSVSKNGLVFEEFKGEKKAIGGQSERDFHSFLGSFNMCLLSRC